MFATAGLSITWAEAIDFGIERGSLPPTTWPVVPKYSPVTADGKLSHGLCSVTYWSVVFTTGTTFQLIEVRSHLYTYKRHSVSLNPSTQEHQLTCKWKTASEAFPISY